MNKPVWIVCADEVHKEAVLYNVCGCHGGKCPPELVDVNTGLGKCPHDSEYKDCLKEYSDVDCGDYGGCRGHWERFIEFVDLEEAEDGEQE